jgi:ABC-2 type transport system ATP-binding protein
MQQMCDRVGIIHKGRIVTVKTVEELISMAQQKGETNMLLETVNNVKAAEILTKSGIKNELMVDGVHVATVRERVPELVSALVTGGVGIYAMDRDETRSLEDIFMKLTGDGV